MAAMGVAGPRGSLGLVVGQVESRHKPQLKSRGSVKLQACVLICCTKPTVVAVPASRTRLMEGSSALGGWDQLLKQGCPVFGPEPLEGLCFDEMPAAYILRVALEYESLDSNPDAKLPKSLDFANMYLNYLKEIWNLYFHFYLISV